VDRRDFLRTGGAAAIGIAIGGCASAGVASPRRRVVTLVPVDVSWDRVIRTTTGLRPHREAGFVLRADRLDEKTVIHNYGHGGAGMSLSWGTAHLAADLAVEHVDRRVAVIGCGIVGLTSARVLQRRGFDVTIYAAALPPETTSNMSLATFTPTSGLVSNERRTAEWDAQFRRAVEIAYREHQLLVGSRHGVSWIDDYSLSDSAAGGRGGRGGGGGGGAGQGGREGGGGLLPAGLTLGREVLGPSEHPFGSRYARRSPTMRFEPSIYLDALMRDVITFGGRIVVRAFASPRDLATLDESLIVNCTGLGSKQLFGDEELIPIKGQLTVLVPQPEVTYSLGTMVPRRDGIVLGHVMERGNWSLEVNEEERQRIVENHIRIFSAMRAPKPGTMVTVPEAPAEIPPVEAFFGRES
jgi:glycine/D-amino acid oxidase-like deaminating enzyme